MADPILIIEILPPSNDRDDVLRPLPAYQRIARVREIAFLESESVAATVWCCGAGGAWLPGERLSGPEARLRLATGGLDVPLSVVHVDALP